MQDAAPTNRDGCRGDAPSAEAESSFAAWLSWEGPWGEGIEIVDEIVFETIVDEGTEVATVEAATGLRRLFDAMRSAARPFGLEATAEELLGALLGFSRKILVSETGATQRALLDGGIVERSGADIVRSRMFTSQVVAWNAILLGEEDRWADCGPANLDEWAANVIACVLGRPAEAASIRRELRRTGVAAFGLVAAA